LHLPYAANSCASLIQAVAAEFGFAKVQGTFDNIFEKPQNFMYGTTM
jgi:hypothetical protein